MRLLSYPVTLPVSRRRYAMSVFADRSPFGIPITDRDTLEAFQRLLEAGQLAGLTRHDTRRAVKVLSRDRALMLAGGRWVPGQPDPREFVAGDVATIRYLAAQSIPQVAAALEVVSAMTPDSLQEDTARLSVYGLTQLLVDLTSAAPYFLPTTAALAVLRSRPPPAELAADLRLPYPQIMVLFGADLRLDPERYPWPRELVEEAAAAGGIEPYDLLNGMIRRGGYVTGLVLLADRQGRLRDDVLWLVSADPNPSLPHPESLDHIRGVLRGWRSQATLRPLVDSLAAAVSWGDWQAPRVDLNLPDDPGSRQWRKAVRRGVFRRREPQGSALGVRVIDLERSTARAAGIQKSRQDRASPAPHLRIGHYRRVRVGPRADWHYEIRWIPPVGVLGYDLSTVDPNRLVVHRLPSPPDQPATVDQHPAAPAIDKRLADEPAGPDVTPPVSTELPREAGGIELD